MLLLASVLLLLSTNFTPQSAASTQNGESNNTRYLAPLSSFSESNRLDKVISL